MNAEVVTVANRVPKEPYYHYGAFIESLRRFGEVPTVLGMNAEWKGLMTKPFRYRDWLRAGMNKSDRLIICDAFDIIFAAHPHGIGDRCAELFGDAVVFNAEKGCWPRADLAEHFPDPGTPWRYLNSGFICGPANQILAMFEAMNMDAIGVDHKRADGTKSEPNDQGEIQALFVKQPVKMVVDGKCQLSQTFSACVPEEFDFSGNPVKNLVTGTFPGVWHFNGDSKNKIMPMAMKKLNL